MLQAIANLFLLNFAVFCITNILSDFSKNPKQTAVSVVKPVLFLYVYDWNNDLLRAISIKPKNYWVEIISNFET